MAQLMWTVRHKADIESDMSAVHRVDDVCTMPSARFFRLAWRLPAYRGAMRERVLAEQSERDEAPRQAREPAARQPRPARQRNPQPVTEAVLGDPVMSKIFSFS